MFSTEQWEEHFCDFFFEIEPSDWDKMLFKDFFFYFQLWWLSCSVEWTILAGQKHFCKIILKLSQQLAGRCRLKLLFFVVVVFFLFLALLSCSVEWHCFSNFSKGPWDEHFCEIILKLSQWLERRCCLNVFAIFRSGDHLVQCSRSILAILVHGYNRNICVKIIWN